jgi:NAD(P)-dependent dehydrogenase (short-subunit alcohol dehydrogenase family)
MSVVVLTGCSSGIGLESALAFAREGDTTIATMRDVAKADELRRRADDDDLEIHVERLDVVDEQSITSTIGSVVERFGAIVVLVNNAGIANAGPIETQSLDNARRVFETNFWGPVALVREVLPTMRRQRAGVIVNVSSLASLLPATMYNSMYAASKRALNAISEALAGEVEPFGIRVVSIEPGFYETAITGNNISTDEPASEVYEADQTWMRSFFQAGGADGHASPTAVADAIVAAASEPDTPLHRPVGDDAAMYLDLQDQVDGYEGWIEAVLPVVEATVGPRPVGR